MKLTGVVLISVLVFNLLWALYTTFSKEKLMIEQGEGALASSTYSFILLRHITRIIIFSVVLKLVPVAYLAGLTTIGLFTVVILTAFVVEILSAVIETMTRLVFFKIAFSKESKKE